MTPPEPKRIFSVLAPMWAMSTAGEEELMVDMLWCSVYHMRVKPSRSACCASSTDRAIDWAAVSPS